MNIHVIRPKDVEWIQMAQDAVHRWTAVSTVRGVWVP